MAAGKNNTFNAEDRVGLKLLENSIHILNGEITEDNINEAIRWILYEDLDVKTERVLTLYVNTEGGDLYQAFALIDIMQASPHTIRTIGTGLVMSAGFLILASGTKGERYVTKNTGLMCHQFSDSSEGKYHDIKAAAKEADSLNSRMMNILQDATDLPAIKIKSKLLHPSDVYLTPSAAVALGIVDQIL